MQHTSRQLLSLLVTIGSLFAAAPSSYAQSVHPKGLFDSILPRKPIDTRIMGTNAFVNDPRFGTIRQQFGEVRGTLGLRYVRILLSWNDQVQPTPTSTPNLSFYDSIVSQLPSGVEALVILTDVPSWMSDQRNWIGGDPGKTFAERWVRVITERYKGNGHLKAFQLWNEPNDESNPNNTVMGFNDPARYVSMVGAAAPIVKAVKPRAKVVMAATTAIAQNFPDTLDYNRSLKENGIESLIDIWAVHYYGAGYEKVILPGGVGSFLNSVSRPIWVTESGEKGVNKQRAYVERTWPFLKSQVPSIQRFYQYQFTEATPATSTYGLKNLTAGRAVSDLYVYLRGRRAAAARRR